MPSLPLITRRGITGIQPYTGEWAQPEVLHLLRRTLFGATVEDVKFFQGMNLNDAVEYLLTVPATQPDPPLKHTKTQVILLIPMLQFLSEVPGWIPIRPKEESTAKGEPVSKTGGWGK